jgi:hypothetical protein
MERIDLKAVMKSTLLTLALAWSLRKTQPKEKGHFCRRWSLEGEGGQMTRCYYCEGERRLKLVWIKTGVNPNRQPP